MTQQEFVKKMDKPGVYIGAYADGLTKGLEIAKEFYEFVQDFTLQELAEKSTDELLTIFLTEKYGNNH